MGKAEERRDKGGWNQTPTLVLLSIPFLYIYISTLSRQLCRFISQSQELQPVIPLYNRSLEPSFLPSMASPSQASLLLQKQLKDLCKNPVDGFSAGLVDESNLFEWSVTIIGPPDTLYDGGFFNAIMTFPQNYPNSPPTVRFTSEVWHPNVYPDGKVCISILHPPGDDPNGYELASERWTPVHTVESIVLSIISMLSSPNDESPANVEAAKEWRDRRDDFRKKVGRCVRKSQELM
ncbi:unnamed protein product [Lactuca saligna]|uniref:E2 ubiquitin-conjugating enzyme n=3 Tax=Lactuca TaxID=4235 RepID=A0AA36A414_LACSI|nr:unnamed protein product [Lactuca saligna]